jgi:hypothetical protein
MAKWSLFDKRKLFFKRLLKNQQPFLFVTFAKKIEWQK